MYTYRNQNQTEQKGVSRQRLIFLSLLGLLAIIFLSFAIFYPLLVKKEGPVKQKGPLNNPTKNIGTDTIKNISLDLNSQPKLPQSLPVYNITLKPFSKEESLQLAAKFGFTKPPAELEDIYDGTIYSWAEEGVGYFIITPETRTLDFKTGNPSKDTSPFPTPQELESLAKSYLNHLNIIDPSTKLQIKNTQYIDTRVENINIASKTSANVVQLSFDQLLDDYPVVNATPNLGTIAVTIDRSGNIVALFANNIVIPNNQFLEPIKSISEIRQTLDQSKIISFANNLIDTQDIPAQTIDSITITNISLGYLLENNSGQEFLQPIFLLSGTARRAGGNIQTLLYLSATKNSGAQPGFGTLTK